MCLSEAFILSLSFFVCLLFFFWFFFGQTMQKFFFLFFFPFFLPYPTPPPGSPSTSVLSQPLKHSKAEVITRIGDAVTLPCQQVIDLLKTLQYIHG